MRGTITKIMTLTFDLPGNDAGVFDLDPEDPTGDGVGLRADTVGCWTPSEPCSSACVS